MSDLVRFKQNIDPEPYKELVEIFDRFLFAMKLCGHNTYCEVTNDTGFLSRKTHCFRIWSDTSSKTMGNYIKYDVYSSTEWATKAKFIISVKDKDFNPRSMAHKLRKAGFTVWNKEKRTNYHYYEIYCYDNILQLKDALDVFADYIM